MRSLRTKLGIVLFAGAATLTSLACGSRSGLLAEGPWEEEPEPEPEPVRRLDAAVADARDRRPGIDAGPDVIVDQRDCKDPSETLIYLVSNNYDLYSFNPRDFTSRLIGPILCPATSGPFGGSTPFSMAVDREGIAYIVYDNGELFRVSTATTACVATDFRANQQGVSTFGMGFASNQGGPAETLFIASDTATTSRLGRIEIPSFDLDLVARFPDDVARAELTGTGDGRLFAFYAKNDVLGNQVAGSFIGQIDKRTGDVVAESYLPSVDQGNAWAFAFWGGDFYTFTSLRGGAATVTRFRPSDGSVEEVATLPTPIVGAGVSTCSPVQ